MEASNNVLIWYFQIWDFVKKYFTKIAFFASFPLKPISTMIVHEIQIRLWSTTLDENE